VKKSFSPVAPDSVPLQPVVTLRYSMIVFARRLAASDRTACCMPAGSQP
jgi:hypothetical protein